MVGFLSYETVLLKNYELWMIHTEDPQLKEDSARWTDELLVVIDATALVSGSPGKSRVARLSDGR